MAPVSRCFVTALVAGLLIVMAGGRQEALDGQQSTPPASPQAQQPPPQPAPDPATGQQPATPDQPIFRAKVDLVRVDVSVTGRDDEPVTDLQASDFQVTEDELPQTVETAQFIRLDGERHGDTGEGLAIRGRAHGMAEAAKEDVRLFALFLDDYHIDKHPAITLPLRRALEKFVNDLGPYDLVVLMDPLTTLDSLRFTRDKTWLIERIRAFEGRRGELFPVRSAVEEAQLTQRNVWELRGAVSLSALEAIATHLGGLREGRKSIIFVSQGPPVGMPGSPNYPRLEAALQAANRGNVTVHVLDPRPLGSAPFGGAESLRRLSAETGGRAIINTNNPEAGLKQVIADASAYYLIGYSPSRERADGKFHRINVRVKRGGVRVTARRGYWAPTPEQLTPEPAPPPDPVLTGALSALVTPGEGRLVDVWVGHSPAPEGMTDMLVAWEPSSRQSGAAPAVLEVEPVARGTGRSLATPQGIQTEPREGDAATVARFQMKPGPAALKLTVRSADGTVLDKWTQSLTILDYSKNGLVLATPRVYRTRSLRETRAFDVDARPTPTASRAFRRTDRIVVDVPWTTTAGTAPEVVAQLTNRDGKVLAPLPILSTDGGRVRVILPLASLAVSTYVVRVEAKAGADSVTQQVAFTVSQ
jgi:VWFA-related protein